MKGRSTYRVPCLLAALVSTVPGSVASAEPQVQLQFFASVSAGFSRTDSLGSPVYRIDRITDLTPVEPTPVESGLWIGCDSIPDSAPYEFHLTGDLELKLDWTVERGGQMGLFFFWGNPGVAELRLPEEGWLVDCRCLGVEVPQEARLHGRFQLDDGSMSRVLPFEGRSLSSLFRILPVKHAETPAPPDSITLNLAWESLS
jgi:hypothetical protein